MGNIQNGEIDYTDIVYTKNVTEEEKYLLKKDDLLFNRTNSPELVGKTAIYRGEVPAIFAGYLIRVAPIIIIPDFLNYLMNSDFHRSLCAYSKSDGVSQSNINAQKLSNFLFPIPPLFEQERITSVIKSTFALIDEVEAGRFSIEQFIKQAKIKILDLAIRGKLVKQNPKDEPVSTFMGKIGNKQNVQKITTDIFHYPFKVPNSWIWAKGSECFNPMENKRPTGDIFGYIDINSIDNKKHTIAKLKYLKASEAPSRASRRVNAGDILFSLVRPYLENIAYVDKQFVDCIASTGFYVCKPRPLLFPKYLYYLMLSPYVINGLNTFMKGDNSPSINNDNITSFLYPLPPLQEQLRIVDQIEKILAQLDKIEEAIKA